MKTTLLCFVMMLTLVHPALAQEDPIADNLKVAKEVNRETAKLSKGDQAKVATIVAMLKRADKPELAKNFGLADGLKDTKAREFWAELIYLAWVLRENDTCVTRGLWFTLNYGKEKSGSERLKRYTRGHRYLLALDGLSYRCTKR